MELLDIRIPVHSRTDLFSLYFLGDPHGGAATFSEDAFDATIDEIEKNPRALVIEMGDSAEFINYSDPRFDPRNVDLHALGLPKKKSYTKSEFYQAFRKLSDIPMQQARFMIGKYKRIKDKIIGKIRGNHEDKIETRYQFNVQDYICKELGVPDLSCEAGIRLFFSLGMGKYKPRDLTTRMVTIFAAHGSGASRTLGGNVKRVEDIQSWFQDADIYAVGHNHRKFINDDDTIKIVGPFKKPSIRAFRKIQLLTGSFFRSYVPGTQTYAGAKLYKPVPLGCPAVTIKPMCSLWEGRGKKSHEYVLPPELTVRREAL